MTQTNLIDLTNFESQTPQKSKANADSSGEADFASELSASSLMLNFFDFNSVLSSSGSAFMVTNVLERTGSDSAFKGNVKEADYAWLREAKERVEEGRKISEAGRNIVFEREAAQAAKSAEAKLASLEDALKKDSEPKAGKYNKATENDEANGEREKTKDIKDTKDTKDIKELRTTQTKSGSKGEGRVVEKSVKEITATLYKTSESENTKAPGGVSAKATLKSVTQGQSSASLESVNGKSQTDGVKGEGVKANLAVQVKANLTAALSATSGTGAPQGSKVDILAPLTTLGSSALATGGEGSTKAAGVTNAAHLAKPRTFNTFLARQVATKMALSFKSSISSAKLTLNPPELGKLRVEIIMEGSRVKATIATENVLVRDSLEASLSLLKQSLQSQGLNVNDINIVLSDGAGNYGKAPGNARGRSASNSRGKKEEAPVENVEARAVIDGDGLDIFI